MTTEQLEKAKQVSGSIEVLKEHKQQILENRALVSKNNPLILKLHGGYDYKNIKLAGELINMEEFLFVYLAKLDVEIAKYEKEFAEL